MKTIGQFIMAVLLPGLFLLGCGAGDLQSRKMSIGISKALGYHEKERGVTVFKNVNLVPMTSDTVVRNQTLVVEGARIRTRVQST